MHTFLYISEDQNLLQQEVESLLSKMHISPFDTITLKKDKSIGIEDIRILQKNSMLAPMHGTQKAALIYMADTMTPDAQNAFLKTLEEPPQNTILLLLAATKEPFLPTVLSRCFIKNFSKNPEFIQLSEEDVLFLSEIRKKSIGQRLQFAQTITKTKEHALTWLEHAQYSLRKTMLDNHQYKHTIILENLYKTTVLIKTTNANPRILLEHFFLTL